MTDQAKLALSALAKPTDMSGYIRNSIACDGKGWTPSKNMHSDMIRTEYRIRFNAEKTQTKQTVPKSDNQFNWGRFSMGNSRNWKHSEEDV